MKRSQKRTVIQFIHSNRNRRTDMFSKKSVLKNFAKFQGSSFVRISLFDEVVDLRPTTLFKKKTNSDMGVHLIILLNFQKQIILQNISGGCLNKMLNDTLKAFIR